MKKQKLSLEKLKVESFVTDLSGKEATIGGAYSLVSTIISLTISATLCPLTTFCGNTEGPTEPVEVEPTEVDPTEVITAPPGCAV